MTISEPASTLSLFDLYPFSSIDEERLNRITHFFETMQLPQGANVFSEGYPADSLYFILSGTVELTCHEHKGDRSLGELNFGDHFGVEALTSGAMYQTRAKCKTKVKLLKLRCGKAQVLRDAYPEIQSAFFLMKKTFQLAIKQKFSWRRESEAIDLVSRRHVIFLFLRIMLTGVASLIIFSFLLFAALASKDFFTPLLILSIITFVIGSGICVWTALEWRNDYFILTQDRVCVQKKLTGIYDSRHESPIHAILSVGTDSSFWGRLLGFGTVTVRTYTGDLNFSRLPNPQSILALIESRRKTAQAQASREDKSVIREVIQRDGKSKTNANPKSGGSFASQEKNISYRSGTLADILANFFRLRVEKEGAIIYHTHWWVLLRKTFFPAFLLLATVLLIFLRLVGFFQAVSETTVYLIGLGLVITGWIWWLYQYQDWQNDIYILADDQLIDVYRKPLGNEDRRSAPVSNIQTVEYEKKGLINVLLNFGTVTIKIGNEELTFDNVYQPSDVQSEIYERYRIVKEKAKRNDQERFVEWIKTYDEIKNQNRNNFDESEDQEKG